MNPARRAAFAAVADVLIPAAHGMPSAGDIGLSGSPLDRVLRARPDLAMPLAGALDRCLGAAGFSLVNAYALHGVTPSIALDAVNAVAAADPAALDLLLLVAGAAYTTEPRVKALLGYPGQQARTLPRAGFGAEDLAAAMMDRPPTWRAAP